MEDQRIKKGNFTDIEMRKLIELYSQRKKTDSQPVKNRVLNVFDRGEIL